MSRRQRNAPSPTTTRRQRPNALCLLLLSLVVSTIKAFSVTTCRHRYPSKRHESSSDDYFDNANDNLSVLLDEAVTLYSKVGSKKDDANDIAGLRKRELIWLVEDVALAMTMRQSEETIVGNENTIHNERDEAGIISTIETLSIGQLSYLLDACILQGYQSTFTEQELDEWVQKVEYLSLELERRLLAGGTSSGASQAVLKEAAPIDDKEEEKSGGSVKELATRLEQYRILIATPDLDEDATTINAPSKSPTTETISKESANSADAMAKVELASAEKDPDVVAALVTVAAVGEAAKYLSRLPCPLFSNLGLFFFTMQCN
jgi:hypothetical protein